MATRNRTSKTLIVGIGGFILLAGTVWIVRLVLETSPVETPALATLEAEPAGGSSTATADRPEETVQALAGSVESIKSRLAELGDSVQSFDLGLDSMQEHIVDKVDDLLEVQGQDAAHERLQMEERYAQLLGLINDQQARLDDLETGRVDYPVNAPDPEPARRGVVGQDGLLWHAAQAPGTGAEEPAWQSLTERFEASGIPGAQGLGLTPSAEELNPPLPAYTIPAEATLVRARGLTALIGRVPIDGQVTDPMPFKVLVGVENLLANGQQLPEVERAIFSGVAFGDATLHCVTGRLEQVAFIFADGTIATYPEAGAAGQALGYIADARGYPCIQGEFISNLHETIGQVTASSLAAGAAQAYAEKQTSVVQQGREVTRSVTGNIGEYALGRGVADGINQWSRIIAERAAQAFDAVLVPPGQALTLHIQQSIPVDWAPEGRKVRHIAAFDENKAQLGRLD